MQNGIREASGRPPTGTINKAALRGKICNLSTVTKERSLSGVAPRYIRRCNARPCASFAAGLRRYRP